MRHFNLYCCKNEAKFNTLINSSEIFCIKFQYQRFKLGNQTELLFYRLNRRVTQIDTIAREGICK